MALLLAATAFTCAEVVYASSSLFSLDEIFELLVALGAKDQFPAMTNPVIIGADEQRYVADDDRVLGLYIDGEARAYPASLGWWHEVVNDRLGGQFVSVTFCPLTGTSLALAAMDSSGGQTEYGVSGLLVYANLVLYERADDTLYPQMIHTGLNGESKGKQLSLIPALDTTWEAWKRLHPDTTLPKEGTGLERFSRRIRTNYPTEAYLNDPYVEYRADHSSLPYAPSQVDLRLQGKEMVAGVCYANAFKAYHLRTLPDRAVINDLVGGLPITLVFDAPSQTAVAFCSELNGDVLDFYADRRSEELRFRDVNTGSTWTIEGEAVAGPLAGARLRQAPSYNAMWFAWTAFFPNTQLWAGEGIIEEPMTTVAAESWESTPAELQLSASYPNPFNGSTTLQYRLPAAGRFELSVHNQLGQRVRTLESGSKAPGSYSISWDGRDDGGAGVSSGRYFFRLSLADLSGGQLTSRTRGVMLLR